MLLKQGLNVKNNADPATIYTAVDVEKFFKDLLLNVPDQIKAAARSFPLWQPLHRIYTNSLAILPFMIRKRSEIREMM